MSEGHATKKRAERPGFRSFPVVMAVFTVLLAAGVALGVVIHDRYVGFERTAARHVPNDAALVVRWDVEKVTLFEPTRRYLLPLLDAAPHAAVARPGESRRQRLASEIGLDIGRDLREAMAVLGPGERDWALVLGGSFPKTDIVGAVGRVLEREGQKVERLGKDSLVSSQGVAFGKSPDGTLVIASSRARLEALTVVRAMNDAVPRTGAGAFVIQAGAQGLGPDVRGVLAQLGDVSRVAGLAKWGSPIVVELTVRYRGAAPPDALERGRRVLAELMGPGAIPPTELVAEPAANGSVTFRIHLNDEALERAARRASDSVYGTLWREGRRQGQEPAVP
jgi:hypothetical protein